mmetsp:Transcript_24947/g.62376  ORF Transcript_24947/g.62376 Transcript_24947/m.62376 type:complete len:291 (+) Transcript_24947:201-1073(+)
MRPGRRTPRGAPGGGVVPAQRHRRFPAGDGPGVGQHRGPGDGQAGRARDQHDAAVGGLVLVLSALRGPAERPRADRPRAGKVLAARGSLRRRRGARRAAPAVRALLAQGAVRLRRGHHQGALPAPRQPGHHPRRGRAHRLPPRVRRRRVDLRGRRRRQLPNPQVRRRLGGPRPRRAHRGGKNQGRRQRPRRKPRHRRQLPRTQDVQVPRQRRQPGLRHRRVRRRRAPPLPHVHGPARASQALEHQSRLRHGPPPLPHLPPRGGPGLRGALFRGGGRRGEQGAAPGAARGD